MEQLGAAKGLDLASNDFLYESVWCKMAGQGLKASANPRVSARVSECRMSHGGRPPAAAARRHATPRGGLRQGGGEGGRGRPGPQTHHLAVHVGWPKAGRATSGRAGLRAGRATDGTQDDGVEACRVGGWSELTPAGVLPNRAPRGLEAASTARPASTASTARTRRSEYPKPRVV